MVFFTVWLSFISCFIDAHRQLIIFLMFKLIVDCSLNIQTSYSQGHMCIKSHVLVTFIEIYSVNKYASIYLNASWNC